MRMFSEMVTYFYLFWPVALVLCFSIGVLIALSIGSFLVGFFFVLYYGYIYLKEKGVFDAIWSYVRENIWVLNERICRNVRETFILRGENIRLEKEPVLYIAHPHGLFSMAPFFHWGVEITDWKVKSPQKVYLAIHSIFFKIPIVREIVEAHGAIEATEEVIRSYLKKGESVALLTGGVRELQATEPGKMRIVLEKRKGFLRIAQSLNVPIVPVLSFGENELFPPYKIAWVEYIQSYLKKWFGIYFPIPTLGSVIHWGTLLKEPLAAKVETWVGKTIQTKGKKIGAIRNEVFDEISEIYRRSGNPGVPEFS